jgi:hemerythrin superfamily protein
MARATPASKRGSRSNGSRSDALTLLKQDHRQVAALIEEVEDAEGKELEAIAERICALLTVHAQIEEELLYPAAKKALDETDLVAEALVEHATAKDLIAKIEGMSSSDDEYKATVTVLGEYVKHHVKEEESEMFPKLKKADVDLETLGERLAARKMEIMQELGIDEEEPDPRTQRRAAAAARAKGKRTGSASRARH